MLSMQEEMRRPRRFPFNIQNFQAYMRRDLSSSSEETQPMVEPKPVEKPPEPEKPPEKSVTSTSENKDSVEVKEVSSSFTQTDIKFKEKEVKLKEKKKKKKKSIQSKVQTKVQPKKDTVSVKSQKVKKKVHPKPVSMNKKKNKKKSKRKIVIIKEPSLPSISSKFSAELARENQEPLKDLDHLPRDIEDSPPSTPPNTATSCSKSTLALKKIIKEVGPKVDCWRSVKLHGDESAKRTSRLKLENLLKVIKVLLEQYDRNNTVVKAKGYLLSLKKEIKDCLDNDLIPVEPSVPDLPTFYEPRTNYKEFNPRRKYYGYTRPSMSKKMHGYNDDANAQDRARFQVRTIPIVDPTSDIVETRLSVRPKLNEAEFSGENVTVTNKPNESGEDPYDILKSFRIGKSAMEYYIPDWGLDDDAVSGYDTRTFYETGADYEPETKEVHTIYQSENYFKNQSQEMLIFDKEEDRELDKKLTKILKDVFTLRPKSAKEVEPIKKEKDEQTKKEGEEILHRLEKEVKMEMPEVVDEETSTSNFYMLKDTKKAGKKLAKNPLISSVKLSEIVYDKSSKGVDQKFVNKNSEVKPGIIYDPYSNESLFEGDDYRLFFPLLVEELFENDKESAEMSKASGIDIRSSLSPNHSLQLKLLLDLFKDKNVRDDMLSIVENVAPKKKYEKIKLNLHRLDEIVNGLICQNLFNDEDEPEAEDCKEPEVKEDLNDLLSRSRSVESVLRQANVTAARKKFKNEMAEVIFTVDRIKKLLRCITFKKKKENAKDPNSSKELFSKHNTLKNLLQSKTKKNLNPEINTKNKCQRIRSLSELISILKEKNKVSMKKQHINQVQKLAHLRSKMLNKPEPAVNLRDNNSRSKSFSSPLKESVPKVKKLKRSKKPHNLPSIVRKPKPKKKTKESINKRAASPQKMEKQEKKKKKTSVKKFKSRCTVKVKKHAVSQQKKKPTIKVLPKVIVAPKVTVATKATKATAPKVTVATKPTAPKVTVATKPTAPKVTVATKPTAAPKVIVAPKTISPKVTRAKIFPEANVGKRPKIDRLTGNRRLLGTEPPNNSQVSIFKENEMKTDNFSEDHDCSFRKSDVSETNRHLNFDKAARNILSKSFSQLSLISLLSQMLHEGLNVKEVQVVAAKKEDTRCRHFAGRRGEESKQKISKGSSMSRRLFSKLCTAVTLNSNECSDLTKLFKKPQVQPKKPNPAVGKLDSSVAQVII